MEAGGMSGWNQAPYPRDQILLFRETLGDRIPQNHTVRLFAEILDGIDWTSWEQQYVLVAGQPPIHPRIMAGAIIYGLTHGVRSSRRLEWICANAVDFMWLVEGRTIDHSTFCGFRTKFKREVKDLFRQIGRIGMHLELISLNRVALDGSRVRANSSRHATASAKTLEERLKVLDEQIEKLLAEADEVDRQDRDLFGDTASGHTLPAELSDLKKRQERLGKALEAAKKADAKRGKCRRGSRRAAKVPVADPDSAMMPNKEGGYAPNYNPVATVDGVCGMIVDADVLNEMREGEVVVPAVERIESTFGQKPGQFLADSGFATGENLSDLARRGIEALMPVGSARTLADNPAERADPTKPVAQEDWVRLPRRDRSTNQLDRAAFVYDSAKDCYYCPMGRSLPFVQIKAKGRATCDASEYRVYQCGSCEGCGLAVDCLAGKSRVRTVSHDQHEAVRCEVAARLKTESGRQAYARRAPLAETPNGFIKQVIGLRQFLLRGLEKVRAEWLWACTASNMRKLAAALGTLRAEGTLSPV
jgi:transposase